MSARPVDESLRSAIELMTAWSAIPEDEPDLFIDALRHHLDGRPPEEALEAAVELVMGMSALCGLMLGLRE
jgi:hypothetical protein